MTAPTMTRKRTAGPTLNGELTEAQQAIADKPVPTETPECTEPKQKLSLDHETIAKRAYEIYQQGGGVDGHALEHWLEAERQLSTSDHGHE